MHNKIYITVMSLVFIAATIILTTFPRPKYSEVEKRDLAQFPEWSVSKLAQGTWTSEVSSWFSDSEPYRERLITLSMKIKDLERLVLSDDNVTFHAADDLMEEGVIEEGAMEEVVEEEEALGEYSNKVPTEGKAKLSHAGIIIVGSGSNVRALMAYGGVKGGGKFANMANTYHEELGEGVRVYAMVIPNAAEFYLPESWKKHSKSQLATLKSIQAKLSPGVTFVNVYNTLGNHADEPIFLRTDHHWSPLGGYYAAAEFARSADVDFKDLESYERREVKRFVGSMYGYSKDISLKEAPEDFVYYVPKDIEYNTTYLTYTINEDYKITKVYGPTTERFFYRFKDGGSGAYSTFMGSDQRVTHVSTSVGNGRKVLIIKDSFGNAIPGYLFYSFDDIFVIDNRYFHLNLKKYIEQQGITDLLFACSIFNAYGSAFSKNCLDILYQTDGKSIVK